MLFQSSLHDSIRHYVFHNHIHITVFLVMLVFVFRWVLLFTLLRLVRPDLPPSPDISQEIVLTPTTDGSNNGDHAIQKQQQWQHTFSLTIPDYNKEERLLIILEVTLDYLETNEKMLALLTSQLNNTMAQNISTTTTHFNYEIVIVNDWSTDRTNDVAWHFALRIHNNNSHNKLKLSHVTQNSGKGFAICTGMLHSTVLLHLMVEKGNTTDMHNLETLLRETILNTTTSIKKKKTHNNTIAISSRAHLTEQTCIKQTIVQTLLMHCFHVYVRLMCTHLIQDTHCGFKMFPLLWQIIVLLILVLTSLLLLLFGGLSEWI